MPIQTTHSMPIQTTHNMPIQTIHSMPIQTTHSMPIQNFKLIMKILKLKTMKSAFPKDSKC
jgi:hypothetical protein